MAAARMVSLGRGAGDGEQAGIIGRRIDPDMAERRLGPARPADASCPLSAARRSSHQLYEKVRLGSIEDPGPCHAKWRSAIAPIPGPAGTGPIMLMSPSAWHCMRLRKCACFDARMCQSTGPARVSSRIRFLCQRRHLAAQASDWHGILPEAQEDHFMRSAGLRMPQG